MTFSEILLPEFDEEMKNNAQAAGVRAGREVRISAS